jgi:voltage-gated potassium channel
MDQRSERIARRFEAPVIVATLLVVPVLILEGTDVAEPWPTVALVGDWIIWLVFLAEVVVLLAVTPDRRRWIAQHPLDVGIVVFTPPFVSGLVQSIRLLRLLRLVRLLRLAQLARGVFSLAGVRYAAILAVLTAVAGGEAFAAIENVSRADGLYWSLSTMTTVGYGDVTPKTGAGRAVAVAVMLVGIGFVAIVTGAVAQRFIAPAEEQAQMSRDELDQKLDALAERLKRIETAIGAPRQ